MDCGTDFPPGLFPVPLAEAERAQLVGQRVSALAPLVTLLAPMAYHTILRCSPAWVRALLEEVVALAPGQVLPVLQVDSAEGTELVTDWGPPLPAAEWEEVVEIARRFPQVCGLIAFTGTALRRDDRL